MACPWASVPAQRASGSPWLAGSLPWKRAPSFLGAPGLPVGGGAGRYSTAVRLARSNWSQGNAAVAASHFAVP